MGCATVNIHGKGISGKDIYVVSFLVMMQSAVINIDILGFLSEHSFCFSRIGALEWDY